MGDLADGESVEVQGSAARPYVLKNTGGVFSCSCPAWTNQSLPIERRTCKHLRKLRGEEAEAARLGSAPSPGPRPAESAATAPPLLLAHRWENDVDLTGWWMSEKLDGVRAYWDGARFYSRLGNRLLAPDWFVEGLPPEPLDGELWVARKAFQRTVSIVRRQDRSDEWRKVTYVVFDSPARKDAFELRMDRVREVVGERRTPHARAHDHERCRGLSHLREELARVEKLGGEGLMLRRPGSTYEVGRSSSLLKVKSFFDAEARVVAHVPGRGRHAGRLGALDVVLPDGTRFSVGTGLSDAERSSPPLVGAIVTVRYQELSDRGVPRFPSYVGVRIDAVWKESAGRAAAPRKARAKRKAAVPAAGAGAKRRFELVEGRSSKFWEIAVEGDSHTVTFGRIGTAGQSKTRTFASADAARADAEKLVAEKTRKGYVQRLARGHPPTRGLDV